jgi:phenolic acid decarboxylase
MKVHVSDPAFATDLFYSLKRANYAVAQTEPSVIEVAIPPTATPEQARLHLGFYLANWRARHPGVVADLVA